MAEIRKKREKLGLEQGDGADKVIEDMEFNQMRKDQGLKDPLDTKKYRI